MQSMPIEVNENPSKNHLRSLGGSMKQEGFKALIHDPERVDEGIIHMRVPSLEQLSPNKILIQTS